jgi:hypothetical protein
MRHSMVFRLKRLLLLALCAAALSSCIGIQSQISLGRDGSGTLQLSYRICQFLREDRDLPLPASREDFQRAVEGAPGLRLEALSQREDEQDVTIEARLAFDRVEALNALGPQLGLSYTEQGGERVFRQRLYAGQPPGGLPPQSLKMAETFFQGYEVSLELSSPVPIRSYSLGQLSEDRRTLRYRTTIPELLKHKDELILEITW